MTAASVDLSESILKNTYTMAKVTYLDNAGFIVKTGNVYYVSDYYRDPAHRLVKELENNPDLPVLFFASSPHTSHYNPKVFNLAQNHKRAYITANQVISHIGDTEENVATMTAGDRIENVLGTGTTVEAFASTESGVSFVITTAEGKTILFGGDLSPMHLDEKPAKENPAAMRSRFESIVNRIAEAYPVIDLAFLAVDPLTGADYAEGARYLVEHIDVKNFVPMHSHGKVDESCDFRTYDIPETVKTKFHGMRTVGSELNIKL